MANKFLDDVGLAHLWDKAISIFAKKTEVEASIAECQKPFIVTATADFVNGVMTNVSHTFAQIEEAYNRGDHIFFDVDISQLNSGQKMLINLSSYTPNDSFFIEHTARSGTDVILIYGKVFTDNSNFFRMTPLVQQEQLGDINSILDTINGEVV